METIWQWIPFTLLSHVYKLIRFCTHLNMFYFLSQNTFPIHCPFDPILLKICFSNYPSFFFFLICLSHSVYGILIFIYLAVPSLSCNMWDLVQHVWTQTPCFGSSLSHWTTREVLIPLLVVLMSQSPFAPSPQCLQLDNMYKYTFKHRV